VPSRQQETIALKAFWLVVGLGALLLAALGLVLPLLPTTPFALVAAFAFARSSQRLHGWLLGHRVFGPVIDHWRRHGAIARRVKLAGVASMAGVFCLSLVLGVATGVLVVQAVVLAGAAAFVLSRPSPPGH